jgi:hypothetical protein
MATFTNKSGSKAVNVTNNETSFIAMYIQIYQGEQQVLQTKYFASIKNAEKWANKILN